MTIATRTEKWEGYRGMGTPCDVVVPKVCPGDIVELSGWGKPIVGKVLETNQELIWCDVPVATPGGGPHVCSLFSIRKLWRGDDYWESDHD